MAIITESLAARLGGQLGQGLGSGLDLLANAKFKQLADEQAQAQVNQERQRIADTYGKLYGKEAGNFLANIDEKARLKILENPGQLLQLNKLLGAGETQTNMSANLGQQGFASQNAQNQTNQNYDMKSIVDALNQSGIMGENPNLKLPSDQQEREKILQDLFTSPRDRREQKKVDIKSEQLQRAADKEVREYLEKFSEKEKAAKRDLRDYKMLQKVAKTPGGMQALRKEMATLERLGLGGFFRTPTADLIEKTTARLAQNAGAAFGPGTRITNFLEKTFQRSIPSLLNTLDGFKAVVQMNKYGSQAVALEEQARRDIIKENGNRIPNDIEQQIQDRVGSKIEELENKALKVAITTAYKTTLPRPTPYNKNHVLQDPESGYEFIQTGREWKLLDLPDEEEEE